VTRVYEDLRVRCWAGPKASTAGRSRYASTRNKCSAADDVVEALRSLVEERPALRGRLAAGSAPRFISTAAEIDAVHAFLRRTSDCKSAD
jgi:hypothetical protein